MKVALQGRAQGRQRELYEEAGIEFWEGGARTEDDLIELIRDADAAQVGIWPLTSRRVMEACPNLKAVSRFGVGVDSIDLDAATELGVMVCNVPGSNTTEVADHAMSLLLSLTRRHLRRDHHDPRRFVGGQSPGDGRLHPRDAAPVRPDRGHRRASATSVAPSPCVCAASA